MHLQLTRSTHSFSTAGIFHDPEYAFREVEYKRGEFKFIRKTDKNKGGYFMEVEALENRRSKGSAFQDGPEV
ncbi:hypothetical protein GCM10007416_28100 [Kroppenstedtia guangzhouensis]|uniref:Uncharacterized protein n=1 Tax=Kroppenstedtia guangzhouensis TaxID=1274356 RepID=A0ABQ1GZ81_9BACL|nr:hypothetical protein GCM10007416_28100 [Kroppenstedtia guangzhouensis]